MCPVPQSEEVEIPVPPVTLSVHEISSTSDSSSNSESDISDDYDASDSRTPKLMSQSDLDVLVRANRIC